MDITWRFSNLRDLACPRSDLEWFKSIASGFGEIGVCRKIHKQTGQDRTTNVEQTCNFKGTGLFHGRLGG